MFPVRYLPAKDARRFLSLLCKLRSLCLLPDLYLSTIPYTQDGIHKILYKLYKHLRESHVKSAKTLVCIVWSLSRVIPRKTDKRNKLVFPTELRKRKMLGIPYRWTEILKQKNFRGIPFRSELRNRLFRGPRNEHFLPRNNKNRLRSLFCGTFSNKISVPTLTLSPDWNDTGVYGPFEVFCLLFPLSRIRV
jgi:hypothetical protein